MKNNTKTSILALFAAFLYVLPLRADVVIDATTFPDENFRNFILSQNYGADGVLTDAEIAGVKNMFCGNKQIASLEGIGYFIALTTLYCHSNQLTELDVSQNTALKILHCSGNQLTELDVSQNTALETLDCYDNQLTAINVIGCINLKYIGCGSNQLTAIDVSQNSKLEGMDCDRNQLTALDMSQNSALTNLSCYDNPLTTLNVVNLANLSILDCESTNLTTLDLSGNTGMYTLTCASCQLTTLEVSDCTKLMYFNCGANQLSTLDLSKSRNLSELLCSGNQLTTLDLSACKGLTILECNSNKLTELDVSGCTGLQSLDCAVNHLTELDLSNNTSHLWSLAYYGQTRDIIAESAVTHIYRDGKWVNDKVYYLRLDNKTTGVNERTIWQRLTENYGGGESSFVLGNVIEWTNGTIIEGGRRAAAVSDIDTDNVYGTILVLTDVTESDDEATGTVSYTYNVNNSLDPDGSLGDFTLNWTASTQIVTDLSKQTFKRELRSVTYYNLSGINSDRPFEGLNVVKKCYSDGTTEIVKEMIHQ